MLFVGAPHLPPPLARGWIVSWENGFPEFRGACSGLYSFAPPALVSCNFSLTSAGDEQILTARWYSGGGAAK
jgi:hypothetical protein